MSSYKVRVNASGIWLDTVIFANSSQHAIQIAKQLFGAKYVIATATLVSC
jgi:hypothetical protein